MTAQTNYLDGIPSPAQLATVEAIASQLEGAIVLNVSRVSLSKRRIGLRVVARLVVDTTIDPDVYSEPASAAKQFVAALRSQLMPVLGNRASRRGKK